MVGLALKMAATADDISGLGGHYHINETPPEKRNNCRKFLAFTLNKIGIHSLQLLTLLKFMFQA